MPKKGLTKESIIKSAKKQIEEKGLSSFSLRNLASELDVQVSSLYNHIKGQNELLTEIGLIAVDMLTSKEEEAITGKRLDSALFALADAYRDFAREHTELYKIIMGVHNFEIPDLEYAAEKIAGPIMKVISDYKIEGDSMIHCQRLLRSVMHGFFAHEKTGGFANLSADRDISYYFAIESVAMRFKNVGGIKSDENR